MQGLLGGGTIAKTASVGTHFLGPNDVSFIYIHFNLGKKSEAKIGLETTGEILKFSLSRVTAQKNQSGSLWIEDIKLKDQELLSDKVL